jgi:hypothetical protein
MTGREADIDAFEGLMINADASLIAELRAEVERLSQENEGLRTRVEVLEGRIRYGLGLLDGGHVTGAKFELARVFDDPDFAAASVPVQTEK